MSLSRNHENHGVGIIMQVIIRPLANAVELKHNHEAGASRPEFFSTDIRVQIVLVHQQEFAIRGLRSKSPRLRYCVADSTIVSDSPSPGYQQDASINWVLRIRHAECNV